MVVGSLETKVAVQLCTLVLELGLSGESKEERGRNGNNYWLIFCVFLKVVDEPPV